MALVIVSLPPATSGGVAGRTTETDLRKSYYSIALLNYTTSGWVGQTSSVPSSRLWNYGSSGAGKRFASALVSPSFKLANKLPVMGDEGLLSLTVVAANRLAFSSVSSAAGTIDGTVSDLTDPDTFKVRVYAWGATGWEAAAEVSPAADGAWSASDIPAAIQYAAILFGANHDPQPVLDGFLPFDAAVMSTLFQLPVGLTVAQTPPPAGGPMAGSVVGINGSMLLDRVGQLQTKVVVFALAPSYEGLPSVVQDVVTAHLSLTGVWSVSFIGFGAQYGVALTDLDYEYVEGEEFPRVGGPVIATTIVSAS